MTNKQTTIGVWKAISKRIESIPVTYSTVPMTPPSSEGKFFRVWISRGYCFKWLKNKIVIKPYSEISEITAISLVLEAVSLTPPLLSVIYDPRQKIAGLCVKQVDVLEKCDIQSESFLQFQHKLRGIADVWHLRRHPYEELEGVDSFVLEVKGRKNVGKMNGRLVLVDVDPKCWADDKQICQLKLSIERAVRALINYKQRISAIRCFSV